MDDSQARKFQKDLNGGLVALVLLAVLEAHTEDLYGYEIAKRLQKAQRRRALFKEGTVYPVLRALAAGGLLTSRVVPSYAGPARRYYRITADGRAMLRSGVTSGGRRAALSIASSKEPTHECQRSPLDR